MAGTPFVLLSTQPLGATDMGRVYPALKLEAANQYRWALLTANSPDNLRLVDPLFGAFGFQRDDNSAAWQAYTLQLAEPFAAATFLSGLPDFTGGSTSGIDARPLQSGATVIADYTPTWSTTIPLGLQLMQFDSAVSLLTLGPKNQAPNPELKVAWTAATHVQAGDDSLDLPAVAITLHSPQGWGNVLTVNDQNAVLASSSSNLLQLSRVLALRLLANALRVERRFEAPLQFSFFKAGVITVRVHPVSILLGFESGQWGVFAADLTGTPWLQLDVVTHLITQPKDFPQLVVPTLLPSGDEPWQPAISFQLNFNLQQWNSQLPLLVWKGIGGSESVGDLRLNDDLFTQAQLFVRARPVPVRFSGLSVNFADWIPDTLTQQASFSLFLAPPTTLQVQGEILELPFGVQIVMGSEYLRFLTLLRLDIRTFRLQDEGKIYLLIMPPGEGVLTQWFDLRAFAIGLTAGDALSAGQRIGPTNYDAVIDLVHQRFYLALKRAGGGDPLPPSPKILFPGNLAGESDPEGGYFTPRILLTLKELNRLTELGEAPDSDEPDTFFLRLTRAGVTFHGEISSGQTVVLEPKTPDTQSDENANLTEVSLRPLVSRDGIPSELLIQDSCVRKASVFADIALPGMKDLNLGVEIKLSQDRRGVPPTVVARFDAARADKMPMGELEFGFLTAEFNSISPTLTWSGQRWSFDVLATGVLRVVPGNDAAEAGDFAGQAELHFENLDLAKLNRATVKLAFGSPQHPIQFSLLDGMLGCSIQKLTLQWQGSPRDPNRTIQMGADEVQFDFREDSSLAVELSAGGLDLQFGPGKKLSLTVRGAIGAHVAINPGFDLVGQALVNPSKPEIRLSGDVTVGGIGPVGVIGALARFPKAKGQQSTGVLLAGHLPLDIDLFPGVVVKEFGAGIACNYRLIGLSDTPTADELLRNLNSLYPYDVNNWQLVTEDGFYVAIFCTAILASNNGTEDVIMAYVADVLACIDTHANFIAAGKLWLASSVGFVRKNRNNPVLVGTMALTPRTKRLTARLQTQPNPAVEGNPFLQNILNQTQAKFSLTVSEELVDYDLEELQYQAKFFDVMMTFAGGLRVATFSDAVLIKAWLAITGSITEKYEWGSSGIEFSAQFGTSVDYRGLVSPSGAILYGALDAHLDVQVHAWTEILVATTVVKAIKKLLKWITHSEVDWLPDRLDASVTGHLAYSGSVGILASGDFGCRGEVTVGVSVLGHDVGFSVALDIDGARVDQAKGQVSAFEQRLDTAIAAPNTSAAAHAAQLAVPRAAQFAALALTDSPHDATAERWAWYTITRGPADAPQRCHLFMPLAVSTWWIPVMTTSDNAPPEFPGGVLRIELLAGSQVVAELVPYWLWRKSLGPQWSPTKSQLEGLTQVEFRFWQTASLDQPMADDMVDESIIRDVRVEGESVAYCRPEDRSALPSVLPYRFESLEEMLDAGATLDDPAVYYEVVRSLYARVRQHRGEDRGFSDDLKRTRGLMAFSLLQAFENPADLGNLTGIQLPNDSAGHPQQLGLIYVPANGAPEITAFQVYRQGSDTPVAVDVVRPGIDPPSGDPGTGANAIRCFRFRHGFEAAADSDPAAPTGAVVVKLPLWLPDDMLLESGQSVSDLGQFEIYRQLPWDKHPQLLAQGVRLRVDRFTATFGGQPRRYVVPQPYLFTDTFQVTKGQLQDPRIIPGKTAIRYSYRMLPGVADTTLAQPYEGAWPADPLYLPAPVPRLDALVLVLAAEDMVSWLQQLRPGTPARAQSGNAIPFRLVRFDQGKIADAGLSSHDFELWAEELRPKQSGFFNGDEFEAAQGKGKGYVQAVGGRQLRPSTAGKFQFYYPNRVAKEELQFERTRLRERFGYQLYIRPSQLDNQQLLDPVQLALVRTTEELSAPPTDGLFLLDRCEFFQADLPDVNLLTVDSFAATDFLLTVDPPAAADFVRNGRNPVQVNCIQVLWQADQLEDGGAEIVIRDHDDPAWLLRKTVEVMEEDVFVLSQRNFASASAWGLSWLERQQRGTPLPAPTVTPVTPEQRTAAFVNVDAIKASPVVSPLSPNVSRTPAFNLLQDLQVSPRVWQQIFSDAQYYVDAAYAYLRSPLNVNDAATSTLADGLELVFDALMVGKSQLPSDSALDKVTAGLTAINQFLQGAQQTFDQLDQKKPSTLQPQGKQGLDDALFDVFGLARPAAALVRRRLVVANEVMLSVDRSVPNFEGEPPSPLPRQQVWDDLLNAYTTYQQSNPTIPLSQAAWFFDGQRFDEGNSAALFACAYVQAFWDQVIDQERLGGLAGVVRQAWGLAAFLDSWQAKLDLEGRTLIPRPHHTLTVGAGDHGAQPVPTALNTFLPDAATVAVNGVPVSPTADQLADSVLFVFTLLERLGFAVDVAAFDTTNVPVAQSELMHSLSDIKVPVGHRLFVVAGQEPDSDVKLPEQDAVGYAFIKVAVVPNLFFDNLLLVSLGASDVATQATAEVIKWLNLRGVTCDTDPSPLKFLSAAAEYAARITPAQGPCVMRVERRGGDRSTVPAVAGWTWTMLRLPDPFGHRLEVAVRRLSRYELLADWIDRNRLPPAPWGWDATRWHTMTVPRLMKPPQRPATPSSLPDPTMPVPVRVFGHPHPQRVCFSYTLPPDGQRSIATALAAVRSGFAGCDLRFHYHVADGPPDFPLENLLGGIPHLDGVSPSQRLWRVPVTRANWTAPSAFAGERLVTIDDLPFFYEYGLDVIPRYVVRKPEGVPNLEATVRPILTRRPSQMAFWKPRVAKSPAANQILYTFTIYLTRSADHLTAAEVAASPPRPLLVTPMPGGAGPLGALPVPVLPDLAMGFRLYAKYPPRLHSPNDPGDELYVPVAEIALPQNGQYRPQPPPVPQPFLTTALIQRLTGDLWIDQSGANETAWPRVCFTGSANAPDGYVVQFQAWVQSSSPFLSDPANFRLQPVRDEFAAAAFSDFSIDNGG